MPPKAKYTREQIAEYAYETVRQKGVQSLSARSLAEGLGVSTAPLFTAFESIENIRDEVAKRARALYDTYIAEGLDEPIPFKGAGLAYIRFAKDEPELFKMLFMSPKRETPSHFYPEGDKNAPAVTLSVEGPYGISGEQAKRLYNHLSVYVHGFAVLFAQGRNVFTDEDISGMLSETFHALLKEIKDEKHN